MKLILKLEQLALFIFSLYLFSLLPYEWYWYPILWILPDVGMVGYLANPKLGSITYNVTHFQGLAVGVYLIGMLTSANLVMLAGVILLGHASLDRVLGYGLKYPDRFKHTHIDEQ